MEKRNLFDEIMNGINAMGAEREKNHTKKLY